MVGQGRMDGAGERGAARLSPARIALIAAALVAAIAIGAAVWRSRPPAPAPVAALPQGGDIRTVIAGLEARMKANPQDPDGWRLLGQGYYETARYGDSARAYEHAAALKPADAQLWAALGEARVLAGDGGVNPAAGQAFERALAIDPKDPRSRYFLAVRKDMAGDHKGAVNDWIALLKDTPPGAPWEDSVRQVTQQVATANHIDVAGRMPPRAAMPAQAAMPGGAMPGGAMPGSAGPGAASDPNDVATAAIPGPTREQMMAASGIPPSQQDQMVRGMVDSLAAKLRADPANPDGWIRLMRARMVLNDPSGAAAALATARAANPRDAARLTAAAKTLGVPGA